MFTLRCLFRWEKQLKSLAISLKILSASKSLNWERCLRWDGVFSCWALLGAANLLSGKLFWELSKTLERRAYTSQSILRSPSSLTIHIIFIIIWAEANEMHLLSYIYIYMLFSTQLNHSRFSQTPQPCHWTYYDVRIYRRPAWNRLYWGTLSEAWPKPQRWHTYISSLKSNTWCGCHSRDHVTASVVYMWLLL